MPLVLWDHVVVYASALHNRTVHPLLHLEGRTPYEMTLGSTPDISHLIDFGFYDPVFYIVRNKKKNKFPSPRRLVGRWLGPSGQSSNDLSYKVLTSTGKVIVSSAVQPFGKDDAVNMSDLVKQFDEKVSLPIIPNDAENVFDIELPEEGDESIPDYAAPRKVSSLVKDNGTTPKGTPRFEIPRDERYRKLETDLTVNSIAENLHNILQRFDDYGRTLLVIDEIVDHYHFVKSGPGHDSLSNTKYWYFLVRWKNGEEDVVRLADIKESHPVELANYIQDRGFTHVQGMSWWVPYTLKKAGRIISKAKTVRRMEKYGIKIPRNAEEAYELDRISGTLHWTKAIEKEMGNCDIAFRFLSKNKRPGTNYKRIHCHLIFDIKPDLSRKARFVARGHTNDPEEYLIYSIVAARDSIRILLMIATLNDLFVSVTDIQNAYLAALPRERVYFVAGPEFKEKQGLNVIIVRALYGLKTSGAAFRAKLAEDIRSMGYSPSLADPDVYLKPKVRPDGTEYYEYLIIYVDDIMCISHEPHVFMEELKVRYTLKNGYDKPQSYLGVGLRESTDGWVLSTETYVSNVLQEIEKKYKVPTNCQTPSTTNYLPELDTSRELKGAEVTYYQGLIGILRWIVELGRIDIGHAVTSLASYNCNPRLGHLQEAIHVFGYLKKTKKFSLLLSDDYPNLEKFKGIDITRWKDYYGDVKEVIDKKTA